MIEPSPRLKKEAKRIGCDTNHIIMADLVLCGYTEVEAYEIAFSENALSGAAQKIADRERELSSDKYKRAYDDRRNARKYTTESVENRDKDDVLRELNLMVSKESDTKMKADLLMKIAEIKQMKKDSASDDEDPVQFFFPIACEKCPLLKRYNEHLEKKNKGLPREKWVLEVRPDEMQRIIEQSDSDISGMRKKEKAGY